MTRAHRRACPSAVLAHVLGQGLRLAAVGIGVGVVAAAAVAQVLQSLLYGVSALDPVAYAFAGAVLLAVAFAANVIPAWRAARTDPMRALRYERVGPVRRIARLGSWLSVPRISPCQQNCIW